jgi:hypothetical protein
MPTVEKTSGGRVNVRGIGEFERGDQADVSTADAQYLVEERGDFKIVDEASEDDAVTAFAFPETDVGESGELTDFTVDEVKARLETGEFDHVLDDIKSAEEHGKDRSTVHDAIDERREA